MSVACLRGWLSALYGDATSAAARAEADAALQSFLRSENSWPGCLELLSAGTEWERLFAARSLHVLLRCAQTTKTLRTQASHLVLSEDEWSSARELFGAAAVQTQSTPLQTQLLLALSALQIKSPHVGPQDVLSGALAPLASSSHAQLRLLRLLPEELLAKELKCRPERRVDVSEALRSAAPALLGQLAAAASADEAATVLCLDAFASWSVELSDVIEASFITAVSNCPLILTAFAVLAGGAAGSSQELQSAACAAACGACTSLSHSAPSLNLLRPLCHSLRAATAASSEAACAVLSHASDAALATLSMGRDADTVEAAEALLLECVDALLDSAPASVSAEPPLEWTAPWAALAEAVLPLRLRLAPRLAPIASRLAAVACSQTTVRPGCTAAHVESVMDAVRDASTSLSGPQQLLPSLAQALQASFQMGDAAAASGACLCAAALLRMLPQDDADAAGAGAALVEGALVLLGSAGAERALHLSAVSLLGACGIVLSASATDLPARTASALLACLRCGEAELARAAAVALMRCAEGGGAAPWVTLLRDDASSAIRAAFDLLLNDDGAAGASDEQLREGQEPTRTLVLRAVLRVCACAGDAAPHALEALAQSHASRLQATLRDPCAHACLPLTRAARDARLLVEAAAFAPLLPALAALASAPPSALADSGVATEYSGALFQLIRADSGLAPDALRLLLAALRASGAQGPYLSALARAAQLHPRPAGAAEAAAEAAALACGMLRGARPGVGLLELLRACVVAGAASARAAALEAARMVLEGRGAAEEEEEEAAEARGRAACSLTAALLVALAGESGADAEAHSRALCRALLDAASGGLPSGCVTPVAEAMHAGWVAAGDARLGGWLRFAMDVAPAYPRAGLEAFLVALLSEANRRDVRRFKRVLKAFCGGKRKGGHP